MVQLLQAQMTCQHTSNHQCLAAHSRTISDYFIHSKATLFEILFIWIQFSCRIPITNGQLNMGTWQVTKNNSILKYLANLFTLESELPILMILILHKYNSNSTVRNIGNFKLGALASTPKCVYLYPDSSVYQ